MTRKQRHLLTRIIVAAVLFLAGSLLHLPELAEMAVFLVCYVVVGWDIVWKAITNILHADTLVSDAERFLRQRTGTKDGGHRIGHIPPASCASDCPVSAITQGREKRDLFLAGRTYPVDS